MTAFILDNHGLKFPLIALLYFAASFKDCIFSWSSCIFCTFVLKLLYSQKLKAIYKRNITSRCILWTPDATVNIKFIFQKLRPFSKWLTISRQILEIQRGVKNFKLACFIFNETLVWQYVKYKIFYSYCSLEKTYKISFIYLYINCLFINHNIHKFKNI